MIETFTALLLAHVLADFTLQTNAMVKHKDKPVIMILHTVIVLLTAQATTGNWFAPELIALALAHMIIDCVKIYGGFRGFTAFISDQAAHIATLIALAVYVPDLWSDGAWAAHPTTLPVMAIACGFIVALTGGQHAVALLMRPHSTRIINNGLRDGGRQIGLLERGLIFVFILTGQAIGVGFLIGAKSILRFSTASRDQRTAEYVIIGTLASFGWAIAAAVVTQGALELLPPLEITAPNP